MRAVANSTPLIYLSKASCLGLLFKVYDEVLVPERVYEEVVVAGLERGFRDAALVKAEVERSRIRVERAPRRVVEGVLRLAPALHRGEAEVIALALRHRPCHVLVDDRVARLVARALGLGVHGTLYVLVVAAARGEVSVEEALEALDRLVVSGFRLSVELYLKVREALRKLKEREASR